MIVLAVIVFLVGSWLAVRRARKRTLAGLDSGHPQFMVGPPSRRHHKLKGERL